MMLLFFAGAEAVVVPPVTLTPTVPIIYPSRSNLSVTGRTAMQISRNTIQAAGRDTIQVNRENIET